LGVEIGVKMGNIITIRKLGAPMVSSLLAFRMVTALFFGWFILGERLTSILQWVGVVLVVGAVTAYLYFQGRVNPRDN
jgi:drug/metabolite transporter (DMT)-like permease